MKKVILLIFISILLTNVNGQNQINVSKATVKNWIIYQGDTLDISLYGKKNILPVGTSRELYSDFSTAVAAADTGYVLELSAETFTESGTITMPFSSTLKIYEGGLLSGTFTLVGNNTRLDAGLYQCFGANVTLLGTWIVDKTYVNWFGMDGTGNEGAEFQKALAFVNLTTGKTLVTQNKTYTIETQNTFRGGTIEGNGATFNFTYSGGTFLTAAPATNYGTVDTLAASAGFGNIFVQMSPGAAYLSSLVQGDLVVIYSDLVTNEIPSGIQAEIKEVDTIIGNNIYFTQPLYDTYLSTYIPKIKEINYIQANLKDFTINATSYNILDIGLDVTLAKNSKIENINTINCRNVGTVVSLGYNITVNSCRASGSDRTGQGYGLAITNASTNIFVNNYTGAYCRHTIMGGSAGLGSPKNVYVIGAVGNAYAAAFDVHGLAYNWNYINCTATCGVDLFAGDDALYAGVWDVSTAYTTGKIVTYGNSLYQLTGTSTGENPETTAKWAMYDGNGSSGFLVTTGVNVTNCRTIGYAQGLGFRGKEPLNNIHVNGLVAENCTYAIGFNLDIQNSTFNNIKLLNNAFKTNSYLIYASDIVWSDISLGDFYANNSKGLLLSKLNTGQIKINSIDTKGSLIEEGTNTYNADIDLLINNAHLICNMTSDSYYPIYLAGSAIKNLTINSLTVDSLALAVIRNAYNVNNITINNLNINLYDSLAATDYIFLGNDTVDYLTFGDIVITCKGNNSIDYIVNSTATTGITNLSFGSVNGCYDALWLDPADIGTYKISADNLGNHTATMDLQMGNFDIKSADTVFTQNAKLTENTILTPTTEAALTGVIYKNTDRFIHDFKPTANTGLNTFVGINAGNFTMTSATAAQASYNSGFGNSSLTALTTGAQNTGTGYGTLKAVTTAASNTASGFNAGQKLSIGGRNTAIGSEALQNSQDGIDNIAIGWKSLYSNTSGEKNTAVGGQALNTNSTSHYNTAIGFQAGYSNSTGAQNVFLGFRAGYNETGSKKLYIANDSTSLGGFTTRDGVLIFGDFDNNYVNIYNKLAIGVAKSPAYTLEVAGTGNFTGDLSYDLCHGYFYYSEKSEVIALTQNVYSKITNATNNLWTNEDSNGLTFAGDSLTIIRPGDYLMNFVFSGVGAGTNDNYRFKLYKNGAAVLGSCTAKSTKAEVTFIWYLEDCVAGDDFSIRVTNTVDNDDVTAENAAWYVRKEHD